MGAGQLNHERVNTGKIDWDLSARRLQKPDIVPHLVIITGVTDRIRRRCGECRADAFDIFADAWDGMGNVKSMPTFVPVTRGGSNPENETPACVFSQRQGA
jgi:hypothetical protein